MACFMVFIGYKSLILCALTLKTVKPSNRHPFFFIEVPLWWYSAFPSPVTCYLSPVSRHPYPIPCHLSFYVYFARCYWAFAPSIIPALYAGSFVHCAGYYPALSVYYPRYFLGLSPPYVRFPALYAGISVHPPIARSPSPVTHNQLKCRKDYVIIMLLLC